MDGKSRFIIQVNETYYVTTGQLLVYDPGAETPAHREGYVDVAARFKKIRQESGEVYTAVRLVDDSFAAANVAVE